MENLAGQSKLSVFGNRLAECRRGRSLTQEEMANQLGVTPQALSKWERGTSACPGSRYAKCGNSILRYLDK